MNTTPLIRLGLCCGLFWLGLARSTDFLEVPHLAAFLTFMTRGLAVDFTTDVGVSAPAALGRLDLRVAVETAAVEKSLAAQPRLLAFHKQQQLVQSHCVSISVRQHVPLYLGVRQAVDYLVHDDLVSVGNLRLTSRTFDSVVTHSCQTTDPARELSDGLTPVLLDAGELDSVHGLVPLPHCDLLQFSDAAVLRGLSSVIRGAQEHPMVVSPQLLAAALHQLGQDFCYRSEVCGFLVLLPS